MLQVFEKILEKILFETLGHNRDMLSVAWLHSCIDSNSMHANMGPLWDHQQCAVLEKLKIVCPFDKMLLRHWGEARLTLLVMQKKQRHPTLGLTPSLQVCRLLQRVL